MELDCLFEVEEDLVSSLPQTITDKSSSLTSSQKFPQLLCWCGGERWRTLLQDSLTRYGMLQCLLNDRDPFPDHFHDPVMSLFGHMTVTCQALRQNIKSIFMRFRKHLYIISQQTSPIATDEQLNSFKYCVIFLHFLISHVMRFIETYCQNTTKPLLPIDSIFDDVITQLTNTIQSLKSCDQIFSDRSNHYMLHVVLHVHWTTIAILYQVQRVLGGNYSTLFLETCADLLKCLLLEAAGHCKEVNTKRNIPCLYTCPCILEVWLLVAKTTDSVSNINIPSFWTLLSRLLPLSSTTFDLSDPYGFSWWILSQVTCLYGYTNKGEWLGDTFVDYVINPPWKVVQDLMIKTFKQTEEKIESSLRWSLSCCLYLYHCWPHPSLSPIIIAWDYYHKNLNKSFHLSSLEINILTSSGSCRQWFDIIKKMCDVNVTENTLIDGTSYELFLKLLTSLLKNNNEIWRQLKTRFYSKFSQRKVLGLTEDGLTNFMLLFLILAFITDTAEVGQQLYSLLNYRGLTSCKEKYLPLIWKGLFTMLLLYHNKGVEFSNPVIGKIKSNIQTLSNEMMTSCDGQGDILTVAMTTVQEGIRELVDERCTGIQCLFDSYLCDLVSNITGQQFLLTLEWISSMVLTVSGQLQELSKSCVSMEMENNSCLIRDLKGLLHTIWQYTSSALIKRSHDNVPSALLAETAAVLIIAQCEWLSPQPATIILESFGLSTSANIILVTTFLAKVLSHNSLLNTLLSSHDVQLKICHSWLRCLLSGPSKHLSPLTQSLQQLDSVQVLITVGGDIELSDPIVLLQQLLKGLSHHFNLASSIEDKMKWRNNLSIILGDLCHYIETSFNTSTLKTCYKVASAIVRHCSKLIYSRTDTRCLLPQLLDLLILPVLSSRRPLPQGMTQLIRGHLHHFLQGLMELDKDEFVNRKIKQIFSRYFHSYLQPSGPVQLVQTSSPNPFMLLLAPAFGTQPSSDTSDILTLSLSIISKQELIFPQQSTSLILTMKFLNQVLQRVQSYDLLLKTTPLLLGRLLSCHLSFSHTQRRSLEILQLTTNILKLLLENCNSHQDMLPCSELLPVIRDYLVLNLSDHKELTLKPLVAIATYYPTLIVQMLPMTQELITEFETKRGCGYDQLLRNEFELLRKTIVT